jgi:hypothetical protein
MTLIIDKLVSKLFVGFVFSDYEIALNGVKTIKYGFLKSDQKKTYINILFYPLDKKDYEEKMLNEIKNKYLISDYYDKFLSKYNGLYIFFASIVFFGLTEKQDLVNLSEPMTFLTDYNDFRNFDYLSIGIAEYDTDNYGLFIINYKNSAEPYQYVILKDKKIYKTIYSWTSLESMYVFINKYYRNVYNIDGSLKDKNNPGRYALNRVYFK